MQSVILIMVLVFSVLSTSTVKAAKVQPGEFVDNILANRYTNGDLISIYENYTTSEKEKAWKIFTSKIGYWQHPDSRVLPQAVDVASLPDGDATIQACDPGAAPYCWRQPIENYTVPFNNSARVYTWITTTTSCDADPDVDYVFMFRYNSSDPDRIRWTSSSNQVTFALYVISPINSYGYNNSEVRMCVGDNTVWYAGGADNVKNNLIIHTEPR